MDSNYFAENVELNKPSFNRQKAVSIPTLIISLITTIVLVVIVLNNWNNITELFGYETEIVDTSEFGRLLVGDEVSLSWSISSDWDLINYTHILSSDQYWELWIKSQNINLNNYTNEVYLEGIVEKIQQGVTVIEVDTIYSLDMDENTADNQDLDDSLTWDAAKDKYLPNVWLYLDNDFFEKYILVNEWEGWVLKIKDIETNTIVSFDYFKCNTAINDQNCDKFNDMFKESSSQKFISPDGIVYYKQSEVQSWFFSNDDLFWFFVNDIEDSEFKTLVKYLKFVNKSFVKENIIDNIDSICWEDWKFIKNVKSYDLYLKNNNLYLEVQWDDWLDNQMTCDLKIDPTLDKMAKLVKLENKWKEDVLNDSNTTGLDQQDIVSSGNNIEKITENFDWNSDVEQFPINLDKTLEFTSRRWHTIVFPSSSIAYAGQSAQKDFDQVWVNCFSVMNVVAYTDKERVNDDWRVKIYECSIKDSFDDSSEKLIYKNIWDKNFVIEILDPSWIKFANNINIVIR